ncbi:hypothetical protein [Arthrobacter sp. H16F315]|nr:hypothetical protein [Arthrobacter sp. H16F315]MDD1477486.1 hypothetical protein [Arthrobacter sp. H16F315]
MSGRSITGRPRLAPGLSSTVQVPIFLLTILVIVTLRVAGRSPLAGRRR